MDQMGNVNSIKTSLLTGVSSNFRTGNLVLDMIMITMFSSVIGLIFSAVPTLLNDKLPALWKWFMSKTISENTVVIKLSAVFNERHGEWVSPDDEMHNHYLIEAVQLKIADEPVDTLQMSLSGHSRESDNTYLSYKTRDLLTEPTSKLVYKGITISFEKSYAETGNEKNSRTERTTVLTFTSSKPTKYIQDFIHDCYAEYVEIRYKKYDRKTKQLYYYVPESDPKENGAFTIYNRYVLKNGKTFDNTFFPERDEIVELVQKFIDKKEEQTNKLSFLLYGIPGAGKTSFIKCMANFTQRSVINVRLGRISTNEELLNVFHQRNVQYNEVSGGNKHVSSNIIEMHQRIFIFEDIDGDAFNIVRRRTEKKGEIYKKQDLDSPMGDSTDDGDDTDKKSAAAPVAAAPASIQDALLTVRRQCGKTHGSFFSI